MVVWVYSGLTSRCRTLVHAYYLFQQRRMNRGGSCKREILTIIWPKDRDCNISYDEVFDKKQFDNIPYRIIEICPEKKHIPMCIKRWKLGVALLEVLNRIKVSVLKAYFEKAGKYISFDPEAIGWEGEKFLEFTNHCWEECKTNLGKRKELHIYAYNGIIRDKTVTKVDYSVINFNNKYLQKAKQILDMHKKWVGVHIRRTDHQLAIQHSGDGAFTTKMDAMLNEDSEIFFYLATDDNKVASNMRQRYGKRIVQQENKAWGRDSIEGMESGIIDLLCLAGCDIILGSYGSSYSRFASQWGKASLVICEE